MKNFWLSLGLVCAATLPLGAYAATLSISPTELVGEQGQPVTVTLLLDSATSVNTVEAGIVIPPGLLFYSLSYEHSAITYFVDAPVYDEASRTISFSGIIPNGWQGTKAKLLTLSLMPSAPGTFSLTFDTGGTHIYRNDGAGTEEPTILRTSTVHVWPAWWLWGGGLLILVGALLLSLIMRYHFVYARAYDSTSEV